MVEGGEPKGLLGTNFVFQRDLKTALGTLMFGNVDAWIMWNLTRRHVTDVTNASRTLLFDLKKVSWSTEMCSFFEIPPEILPEVRSSAETYGQICSGLCQSFVFLKNAFPSKFSVFTKFFVFSSLMFSFSVLRTWLQCCCCAVRMRFFRTFERCADFGNFG